RELLTEILQRGLRQWRIERALDRYVAGEVSFGAAAEHAGLPQSELSRHAYARGMEPPFTAAMLADELS
ncbi:MAG: antitoxin, partial [bacterium]|nr:antitoxin [bacterium]